jgi:MYXO-CTERM domain-containing protein
MQCRGILVLSDTHYPGWTATVDGHPANILEVYGGLRGVIAERGAHRIEMRYRPVSVYAGAALSLLGLIAAFAIRRRDSGS